MNIADVAAGVAAYGLVEGDPRLPTAPLGDDEWQELVAALSPRALGVHARCRRAGRCRSGDGGATKRTRCAVGAVAATATPPRGPAPSRHRGSRATPPRPSAAQGAGAGEHRLRRSSAALLPRHRPAGANRSTRRRRTCADGGRWLSRRAAELRPGFDRRFAKSVTMLDRLGGELDIHRTLVRGVCGFQLDLDDWWASPARCRWPA